MGNFELEYLPPLQSPPPARDFGGNLLVDPKERNDKSSFLAQAGFTQENPEALLWWGLSAIA
jgi:hypothetical protein